MIVHIVAFRFRDELDAAQREQVLGELRRLPEHFPTMRDFRIGRNESRRDDRFEHAFTACFSGWDELDGYLRSERHEHFVASGFRPYVAERAIVSFWAGEDGAA